jgi:hypothetical protein
MKIHSDIQNEFGGLEDRRQTIPLFIQGKKYHCPICGNTVTVEYCSGLMPTPSSGPVLQEQLDAQRRFEDPLYAHDWVSICRHCMDQNAGLRRRGMKSAQLVALVESACDTIRLLRTQFRAAFSEMVIPRIMSADLADFNRLNPRLYRQTLYRVISRRFAGRKEDMVDAYLEILDFQATAEAYLFAERTCALSILWRKVEIAVSLILENIDAIRNTLSGKPFFLELSTRLSDSYGPGSESHRTPVGDTEAIEFFFPVDAGQKVEEIIMETDVLNLPIVDVVLLKKHLRERLLDLIDKKNR